MEEHYLGYNYPCKDFIKRFQKKVDLSKYFTNLLKRQKEIMMNGKNIIYEKNKNDISFYNN